MVSASQGACKNLDPKDPMCTVDPTKCEGPLKSGPCICNPTFTLQNDRTAYLPTIVKQAVSIAPLGYLDHAKAGIAVVPRLSGSVGPHVITHVTVSVAPVGGDLIVTPKLGSNCKANNVDMTDGVVVFDTATVKELGTTASFAVNVPS